MFWVTEWARERVERGGSNNMSKPKKYNGYLRTTFYYNDKRHWVYAKTNLELSEKVKKKREELEKGMMDLYNPTIKEYYGHFTKIRSNQVRPSTIRAQTYQFNNISKVVMENGLTFGEMRIKDITRRNIEDARQILLESGKTPENLNICFKHLNHVFNNAVLDETIEKNPCKALKELKRAKEHVCKTKHRALSENETALFFEASEKRNSYYKNLFKLMISTGMRLGEATALYLTDIDRKNGFIYVRRTITRDENGMYYVGSDAKTKSGIREIPLTEDIIQIIKDQEELNRICIGLNWSGLLFQSIEGGILREYTVNREINRICKIAGIEKFSSHAFRDTFATRFIEQRPQDYKILSEIMGHKNISQTLDLYTQVMTENKVRSMNEVKIKIS